MKEFIEISGKNSHTLIDKDTILNAVLHYEGEGDCQIVIENNHHNLMMIKFSSYEEAKSMYEKIKEQLLSNNNSNYSDDDIKLLHQQIKHLTEQLVRKG